MGRCRTVCEREKVKALHLVNARVDGLSICLGQVVTDEKSNQISAVPMLLDMLSIEGAVVTHDAMNCQTKTVARIRDKKADYLITVKKNQPKLHQQIVDTFADLASNHYQSRKCRSHRTARKRVAEPNSTR